MSTGPFVIILPGLAVRSYAKDAVAELEKRGYATSLLPAPAWRGVPKTLTAYGMQFAERLVRRGRRVDLLVGLSVGTQAAALAAVESDLVDRLLLVSPMVDPTIRSPLKLLGAWLFRHQKGDPSFRAQVPDWAQAGLWRIVRGFVSALAINLEQVLPRFRGQLTIVQPEWNTLSSNDFTWSLAHDNGGRFILMADAPHSWPLNDPGRFADLVDELVQGA